MFSGKVDDGDNAQERGASAFVGKPLDPLALVEQAGAAACAFAVPVGRARRGAARARRGVPRRRRRRPRASARGTAGRPARPVERDLDRPAQRGEIPAARWVPAQARRLPAPRRRPRPRHPRPAGGASGDGTAARRLRPRPPRRRAAAALPEARAPLLPGRGLRGPATPAHGRGQPRQLPRRPARRWARRRLRRRGVGASSSTLALGSNPSSACSATSSGVMGSSTPLVRRPRAMPYSARNSATTSDDVLSSAPIQASVAPAASRCGSG